jgi:phosphatidylserine decarboxylase
MVAWHPKSSELNERSSIVIETIEGKEILVRQIAGAVARRIVTYAKENQEVMQGDELGFIKFGSRVDIFLPVGTEIEIPILQQVRANKDIIAKI